MSDREIFGQPSQNSTHAVSNRSPAAFVRCKAAARVISSVVLCTFYAGAAFGLDLDSDWRKVATPWTDPLQTLPSGLERGTTIQGDQLSRTCTLGLTTQQQREGLSLLEILEIGICNNPTLKGNSAAIRVQAAALGEARATYLPTVSAGLSRQRDRTSYPEDGAESTSVATTTKNIGLTWRILDAGSRSANNGAAEALLAAAVSSQSASVQKILGSLVGAFFDVQTAQAARQSKQQVESLAHGTLDTARRRESRGAASQTETLQAATALAKASLERSRAQGDYDKSVAVLSNAMGIRSSLPLNLKADIDDEHHAIELDLGAWQLQATQLHPAILAARSQLKAARQKVIVAEADGLPTLDLGANIYQNGRPNQGLPTIRTTEKVVSVSLNIPIFDGFGRTYKVRGAQAQVEQSEAGLEEVTNQVLQDVVKTYADLKSALGNLDASATLLRSAQDTLQSIRRKFDRGASDVAEILSAQSALADAEAQRVRARAEWRSARLRLLANAGTLGLSAVDRSRR